eukprot:20369_6
MGKALILICNFRPYWCCWYWRGCGCVELCLRFASVYCVNILGCLDLLVKATSKSMIIFVMCGFCPTLVQFPLQHSNRLS